MKGLGLQLFFVLFVHYLRITQFVDVIHNTNTSTSLNCFWPFISSNTCHWTPVTLVPYLCCADDRIACANMPHHLEVETKAKPHYGVKKRPRRDWSSPAENKCSHLQQCLVSESWAYFSRSEVIPTDKIWATRSTTSLCLSNYPMASCSLFMKKTCMRWEYVVIFAQRHLYKDCNCGCSSFNLSWRLPRHKADKCRASASGSFCRVSGTQWWR